MRLIAWTISPWYRLNIASGFVSWNSRHPGSLVSWNSVNVWPVGSTPVVSLVRDRHIRAGGVAPSPVVFSPFVDVVHQQAEVLYQLVLEADDELVRVGVLEIRIDAQVRVVGDQREVDAVPRRVEPRSRTAA